MLKSALGNLRIGSLLPGSSVLDAIAKEESRYQAWSDEQIKNHSRSLCYRARSGEKLDRLIPEAYAIVRESSHRVLGLRHYDVQVLGGYHLAKRQILEMDTGEGKTLTATLPLYLYALAGDGVHLATANDYLASRDAEEMEPLFHFLGLSVGTIISGLPDIERRVAYHCDITYGTASEFGFDLLRDRLKRHRNLHRLGGSGSQPVGRKFLNVLLVDEADKSLVDEATTPLVLAGEAPEASETEQILFRWASVAAPSAKLGHHFEYDRHKQNVELTKRGRRWARTRLEEDRVSGISLLDVFTYLERAIKVNIDFHRDRNYLIDEGVVLLINEHTGRLGRNQEWHDGIQQAIQAREGIPITNPSSTLARVTLQAFFLAYKRLAGMTGTAKESRKEIRKIYKCRVVRVEPHRPCQRITMAPGEYTSDDEMIEAVVKETQQMLANGRSVLVGTRTVSASERLSRAFATANIQHQLLNAKHEAEEANMVAVAGQPGKVTVATNMAGRGTDIKLDPSVKKAGGLHTIITQVHESPRIDRQLIGRCGRQGDPGSFRYHVSLEDNILELAYGSDAAIVIRQRACRGVRPQVLRALRAAQHRLVRRDEVRRYSLMHHEERRLSMFWRSGIDPLLDLSD